MTTSRDWGNEVFETLKWLAIAFSIITIAFVAIAAVLLRYTQWGKQFWAITGEYFRGPQAPRVWAFLAILIFLTVFGVRLNVLFSYWSADLYDSFQTGAAALGSGDAETLDVARDAFWSAMVLFAVLATIHVARAMVSIYLSQVFDIQWREWLTDNVTHDWLGEQAFYRGRFIDNTIDNPDQRIESDITKFATYARTLTLGGGTANGAVGAVVTVVSFTKVLWDLSGPISLLGIEIPRAMSFLVIMYVLITSVVAFWIGRPLIRLNFLYERVTANFRYALVRLRDSSESVAFYRGERVEQRGLMERFAAVVRVLWQKLYRYLKFTGWNFLVNQTSVVFPYLIQAPRFFDGQISLGGMQQTGRAFGEIHAALSFFREAYDTFAEFRASLMRLDGLITASRESRDLPKITNVELADALELDDITVRRPDGHVLVADLELRLVPGDALVVKGVSGSGKTTLLRTLAQMWPYGSGTVRDPGGDETLFLSQVPYLPLGDLRTVVSYPADPGTIDDDTLRAALTKVHLGQLVNRLDEEADWSKILSPGEQQRLAFARVLLTKPAVVFVDEATSAVDEGLEHSLYTLVRTELPALILVSVAHRSTVDQFHTKRLELDGNGPWRLEPLQPVTTKA
ncbi:ABC transporter ATP-binding protein/permease [Nocardia crassostreae]|uniref:ABC transporter ATP-binding protein/permease n=1 Tax=Nocardia crassostreae TaxID=53428 RepID=UPI000833ED83|nr:ABC transporter ATP-binding protein/permease [Nocardia crassostreae]